MTSTATATFDAMTNDDRWLGFGYLAGRSYSDATDVAQADSLMADHAAANGWTADDLFTWANSKAGRHFGDVMLFSYGTTAAARFADAVRWNLTNKQSA